MTLTKEAKNEIIQEHALSSGDTGSAEVQVAVLTQRIDELTEHLKTHKQDHALAAGSAPDGRTAATAPGVPQA